MLLYQLNSEVVNLPYIANTYNKSDNLTKRDSLLDIIIPNHYSEGAVVWGVRTERNFSQC